MKNKFIKALPNLWSSLLRDREGGAPLEFQYKRQIIMSLQQITGKNEIQNMCLFCLYFIKYMLFPVNKVIIVGLLNIVHIDVGLLFPYFAYFGSLQLPTKYLWNCLKHPGFPFLPQICILIYARLGLNSTPF